MSRIWLIVSTLAGLGASAIAAEQPIPSRPAAAKVCGGNFNRI